MKYSYGVLWVFLERKNLGKSIDRSKWKLKCFLSEIDLILQYNVWCLYREKAGDAPKLARAASLTNWITGQHSQAVLKKETLSIIVIFAQVVTFRPDTAGEGAWHSVNLEWKQKSYLQCEKRNHSTPLVWP